MTSTAAEQPRDFTARTAWARSLETPLRRFLRTETASAVVLVGAILAALVWANVDESSYERVWNTTVSLRVGDAGISEDLRFWINSGLMTFFFFVVGLEALREIDLGDLRERRRIVLARSPASPGSSARRPHLSGDQRGQRLGAWVGGGDVDRHALALGLLALVGPRFPDRLRALMRTVAVTDDIVALVVIATVYAGAMHYPALFCSPWRSRHDLLLCRYAHVRAGIVAFALGLGAWFALSRRGSTRS